MHEYCIRLLRGSLEVALPGRQVDVPTAPSRLGPLIVLALHPGRVVSLEELKTALYDADPATVTRSQIHTPISRLRGGGLPIPPRTYMLDLAPSDVDIVDFDIRAKWFIDRAVAPDRLSDDEASGLLVSGFELHELWQHDPAAAIGRAPHLAHLFERHRRRHRRFGSVLVRLLLRVEEPDRAEDILDQYVERYGSNAAFRELEGRIVLVRSPTLHADEPRRALLPASGVEGSAMADLRGRIAASAGLPIAQLALGAHNLDRIYTVDSLDENHPSHISGVPVEAAGGSAANTAFALAQIGEPVAVAGIIAGDRDGAMLRQSFASQSIDVSQLVQVPATWGPTGKTLIFSDPRGRRKIYFWPGVNEQLASVLRGDKPAREALSELAGNARLVNLSSFSGDGERHLQQELMGELSEEVIVAFDPGEHYAPRGLDGLAAFILRCDVLYVYETRLRQLIEHSSFSVAAGTGVFNVELLLEALFQWRGARIQRPLVVVVKCPRHAHGHVEPSTEGYEKIVVAAGQATVEYQASARAPASPLEAVEDGTGQGDAIAAAVHAGLLRGAPLDECADLASVFANEVVSEIGARNGLPSAKIVAQSWAKYFPGRELPAWLMSPET